MRLLAAVVVLVVLGACGPDDDPGPCGYHRAPGLYPLQRAPQVVAPGGTLRFGTDANWIDSVAVDPPGAASYTRDQARQELELRGLSEGTVTITVTDRCGATGSTQIEVRPVASVGITVQAVDLPGYLALPEESTASGIVVLPRGMAWVVAVPLDAAGRRVHGVELSWASTEPSVLEDFRDHDEDSGAWIALVRPAEGVSRATLSTSAGGELSVSFLPELEVAAASVFDAQGEGPLANLDLLVGTARVVALFPLDLLGRPVFGAPAGDFEVTVDDPGIVGQSLGEPPELPSPSIPAVRLEGLAGGETDVTLSAFGIEAQLPVAVRSP